MGNNRIFYSCLGVALTTPNSFPSTILEGVQSVGVSSSKNLEYFLPAKTIISSGYYTSIPDIGFNYSQLLYNFEDLADLPGVNDYVDLYMFIGEDDAICLDARKYIVCKYLLLESIEYNLSVDNSFNITKNFKGFSRYICSSGDPIIVPQCDNNNGLGLVKRRQHFLVSGSIIPSSIIDDNALQNITIKQSINRKQILETGTKTPYGSAVNFPIENNITFEVIAQNLDNDDDTFSTISCNSLNQNFTDLTIQVCDNENNNTSITINDAFLSNIDYAGGDTGGGNQKITISYTSYDSTGINSLIEFPSNATTGCL